ncbi:Ig-like domain-containing protein, partial [Ursidibacter sp. B-7004-1]
MSIYRLKVTTKTSEKTVVLSQSQTIKIPAEDNTKYQIVNEQGELVNELKTVELNKEDIGIYLDGANEPNLVLENYYAHYPIENPQYLSDISASLATGSKDSPFVLASEVGGSGLLKAVLYGLGAVATLGAVFTFFKSGGSKLKKAESESSKTEEKAVTPITKTEEQPLPQPEPSETIEPINVNIQFDSVTSDNVINRTEQAGSVTISGSFTADQPITSAKVVLEIGGQKIDAIVDGNQFKAEVSGNLLAENNQINATVEVTNDKSKGTASSSLDYLVDVILTHPTISLNEITEDNVINLTESQNTQMISGTVTNAEGSNAKVGDNVVIQLGDHLFNAKLDENLQFTVEISGQILSENNKLEVTLVT